jgi:hypothetical protein
MGFAGKCGAVMAAMGLAMSSSPVLAANCWSDTAYQAAQVRDFETMMMVSTLRCRLSGVDFSTSYNRFVREKRSVIITANTTLQQQFARAVGAGKALGAYDDFMTKVANSYGGGMAGMNCRDFSSVVDAAVSAPATMDAVAGLASAAGVAPAIPGARCNVTVAMDQTAR